MALFRQGLGSALVDNSSVEPFGRHFSGEGKYRRALEAKEHAGNVTVGALCQPPERSGGGFPGLAYFFRWAVRHGMYCRFSCHHDSLLLHKDIESMIEHLSGPGSAAILASWV